jgi:flagellar biogenesis protein FliO
MSVQQSAAPAPTQSATAPAIPFRRDDGAMGAAIAGGGVGILVISLLAIALVLYLRRRFNLHPGAAAAGRLVRVVESTRLGPRTLLSVVEFDGSRYLVAQGEHGVSCLAEKPMSARTETT